MKNKITYLVKDPCPPHCFLYLREKQMCCLCFQKLVVWRRRRRRRKKSPSEDPCSTHTQTWKILNLIIPEETASRMPRNMTGHIIQAQNKLARKPRWLDGNKIFRCSYRSRTYSYNTLPGSITSQTTLVKFKKALNPVVPMCNGPQCISTHC